MRSASQLIRAKVVVAAVAGLLGTIIVVGGVSEGRPGVLVVGGLFFAVTAALIVSLVRSDHRRTLRKLKARGRTPISEALPGQTIKIVGRVRVETDRLIAPLSGLPCVYYALRGREASSDGGEPVPDVFRIEKAVGFLIDDGTGVASIEALRTSAVLPRAAVEVLPREAAFERGEAAMERALTRKGPSRMWVAAARILRIARGSAPREALDRIDAELPRPLFADFLEESTIEEGATVAALGRVMAELDPDPGALGVTLRDRPRRVRLVAISARAPVCVSDDPETFGRSGLGPTRE
jgi:hypothetical protein